MSARLLDLGRWLLSVDASSSVLDYGGSCGMWLVATDIQFGRLSLRSFYSGSMSIWYFHGCWAAIQSHENGVRCDEGIDQVDSAQVDMSFL